MGNLRAALTALGSIARLRTASAVYETAPLYVTDQPVFLNMAVLGETDLAPLPLLAEIKAMEDQLGRVPGMRFGPRLIDIDILYLGDAVLESDILTLPHPRMAERRFVLQPLADIAPDWRPPAGGPSVSEMLAALPADDSVRRVEPALEVA